MPRIYVKAFGFRKAALNMQEMGAFVMDGLGPTLDRIADDIAEIEEKVFSSQGRRGGGEWKDITPRWRYEKKHARPPGDSRIGHFRKHLRRSLTYRGDPMHFEYINPKWGDIKFGSRLPYARNFSVGNRYRGRAARPVFKFVPGDRQRWDRWIARAIKAEWKGRAQKRIT